MKSTLPRFSVFILFLLPHLGFAQVDWKTWSADTLAVATETAKPIYLFIDEPLSELANSMDQDTFTNAEVAAFLNAHFVCVRASRDEVPGIAAYGQQWLAAEQKLPGWPLNLWFTPDQLPIEGASYLPPTEEWGREGFMVVAKRAADQWTTGTDGMKPTAETWAEGAKRTAERRQQLIADYLPFAAEGVDDLDAALTAAAKQWIDSLGQQSGLFGEPPHRAEPELLRFLIQRGGKFQQAALTALKARIVSPLRDPIDGGLYRSTVDTQGSIPVFQKRLTDQARFALACLDAAAVSNDPIFAAGAKSVIDYAINRLSPGDGTFIVGEDATQSTTAMRQTWSHDELTAITDATVAQTLGALAAGNVDSAEDLEGSHAGRNILRCSPLATTGATWRDALLKLQSARDAAGDSRIQVIATAADHGLMLHVMQRAADQLGDLDYGAYLLGTRAALLRDFGAGTEFFSHQSDSEVPALPLDYLLVGLGLNRPDLISEADALFYDDEFGLYYATTDEVFGVRPLMGTTGAGELPGPASWRVTMADPDEILVTELTAAFDNPDVLPAGDVLLAFQTHRHRE